MSNNAPKRVRRLATVLAAVAATLSATPALTASTVLCAGKWKRVDIHGPDKRTNAAVAYDEARQRVVLFGGSFGQRTTVCTPSWFWIPRAMSAWTLAWLNVVAAVATLPTTGPEITRTRNHSAAEAASRIQSRFVRP